MLKLIKGLNNSIYIVIFMTFLIQCSSFGKDIPDPPVKNENRFKIAYYEGGPYTDYVDSMKAIITGLMELGWIEKSDIPEINGDMSKPYWSWLVKEADSRFLEFRDDNAFSGDWNEENRKAIRSEVIKKLNSGEIDLIIAMGTWAGQDLANKRHSVPTIVVSTSDPIEAGIIKNVKDSGLDHITARVDQERYPRQIRMFHRLTGFKRLGVAYGLKPEDRIYSAIPDVEKVSAERGFEVETCRFDDINTDREKSRNECIRCFESLSDKVDAVYVTALISIDEEIDQLVDLFNKKQIPSFSMLGSKYVKKGILMSISTDEGYRAQGLYDAEKIVKILTGTRPRDLSQELPDPLFISINLETAGKIGFQVPGSILRIANEIYGKNE